MEKDPIIDSKYIVTKVDLMVKHFYNLFYKEAKIIDPELALSEEEYINFKIN